MVCLSTIDTIILDIRRLFLSSEMSEPETEKSRKKASKKGSSRVVKPSNPSKKRKLDTNAAMSAVQTMQNSLDNLRESIIPAAVSSDFRLFCDFFGFLIL